MVRADVVPRVRADVVRAGRANVACTCPCFGFLHTAYTKCQHSADDIYTSFPAQIQIVTVQQLALEFQTESLASLHCVVQLLFPVLLDIVAAKIESCHDGVDAKRVPEGGRPGV